MTAMWHFPHDRQGISISRRAEDEEVSGRNADAEWCPPPPLPPPPAAPEVTPPRPLAAADSSYLSLWSYSLRFVGSDRVSTA